MSLTLKNSPMYPFSFACNIFVKSPDEYSMLQKIEENINIFSRRSLSDLSK